MKIVGRASGDLGKNFLVFGLLVLFAYQAGIGLFRVMSEFSLGSIARNMFPALFVVGLMIIILSLEDFGFMRIFLQKPEITIRQVILIGLAAVFLGVTIPLIGGLGLTEFMVIIAVMLAFFLSLYFMLFGKRFYAVIIFLLVFPLSSLLEFRLLEVSLILKWGGHLLAPTLAFLLVLFFISLIPQKTGHSGLSMPLSLKLAILIFILISILSSILSINPLKSLRAFFLELACPLILFFFILRNLQEEKQVKILAYSMVASLMLFCFLNLYFFTRYYVESSYVGGVKQIWLPMGIHAAVWGTMIILVLPIAIVLFFLADSKKLKLILFASIGFLLFCLVYSLSRSAIISVFVFLSVLMIAKGIRRYILLFLLILIIGMLVSQQFRESIFDYFFPGIYSINDIFFSHTITARVSAWITSLQIIKDYPILGIGTGLWEDYIPLYGIKDKMVKQSGGFILGYISAPHNQYLEIAVNSGIIALFIWIFILILIFKNAIKIISITKVNSRYYLTIGSVAGMTAYLIVCIVGGGFVDHAFPNIGAGIYFFGVVSVIVKLMHFEKMTLKQSVSDIT